MTATTTPSPAASTPTPLAGLPPALHASAPQALPFAPTQNIRAFLLEREAGNIVIYSNENATAEWARAHGGASRRYLNHRHEAMFPADAGGPLYVHEADARSVGRALDVRATFSRRHTLDDDFEVIPTPGHTKGATAYLWDSGEHRLLFTGDTIYFSDGGWRAAVLDSSDRDTYLESLHALRELDFDVLVPWAASRDMAPFAYTDAADARRRLDEIIERVRNGADG